MIKIIIEGAQGAGKTQMADKLREALERQGVPVPEIVEIQTSNKPLNEYPHARYFDAPKFCGVEGCWIVKEELVPESRGNVYHRFTDGVEALNFYHSKTGKGLKNG